LLLVQPNIYSIQTRSGIFDYETPKSSTVQLDDIVHCLSNVCRWGGHCDIWFSVLQHEIFVHDLALRAGKSNKVLAYAINHDKHEGFRGDITTPRKNYLKKHGQLFEGEEKSIDAFIFEDLLGLEYPIPANVKEDVALYDFLALATEKVYLWENQCDWVIDVPPPAITKGEFDYYLQDDIDWKKEYYTRWNACKP
jgi:hypothetical protein